ICGSPFRGANAADGSPSEFLIVEPEGVDEAKVAAWKKEGFKGIVVDLDERFGDSAYAGSAKAIISSGAELCYWIEIGRNPRFAAEHPNWMASIGMHNDWRKRFPKAPQPGTGEVVKAWPWVPIAYRDAFDAHLSRVRRLLSRVPAGYRGV